MLNMPIKTLGDRIVLLKDIATLDYREKSPSSYYRINGLNQLNINIFVEKNANNDRPFGQSQGIRWICWKRISGGKYSLQMAYDANKELEDELNQTLFRTLLDDFDSADFCVSGEPGFPLFVDYRRFFSC